MTYGTPEQPMTDGGSTRANFDSRSHTVGTDAPFSRDPSEASVGELMGDISRNLSTLMRQELELAKAEVRQEATKAGKAAGMLGGAGFAGYMTILFLSFALWWALENVMDAGWAALIVAVLWGATAVVLFVVGRNKMRQVNPKPEQTVETIKETPAAIKDSTGRNS
jgi:Putative Actinobacterial Holin-X, holin superfamily III